MAWLVEREDRLQGWMRDARKAAEVEKLSPAFGTSAEAGGGGGAGGRQGGGRGLGQSLQAVMMLKRAVLESHALSPSPTPSPSPSHSSLSTSSSSPSAASTPLAPPPDPQNFSTEDWAISYASWLQEARILYATIKPPDMAFQASATFYRYRDPWEVRVVSEAKGGGDSVVPAAGERFRLGRYFYYKPPTSCATSSLVAGVETLGGVKGLRELWDGLRGESWVVSLIGSRDYQTAALRAVHKSNVVLSPCPAPVMPLCPFYASLQLHLHRNNLYARLGMAQRFIGSLQVTLLGIKEVATVGGALGATSLLNFAPPSSMEIFMMVFLGRSCGEHSRPGGAGFSASQPSLLSFKQKDTSAAGSAGRVPVDGTYTGQPRRADIFKPPPTSSASTKRGGVGGGGGVEYKVRDRALLRFPLPEGLSKVGDSGGSGGRHNSSSSGGNGIGGNGAAGSDGSGSGSASRGRGYLQRAEEETWRGSMYTPPNALHLILYEKTFLSENRLGEVHLPLTLLAHDQVVDEWHPLINERRGGGAWLVRLQLQLSFLVMCMEAAPTLLSRGGMAKKVPNKAGQSGGIPSMASLLLSMEDVF